MMNRSLHQEILNAPSNASTQPKPSAKYLETAQRIAQAFGLDVGKIIEGYPVAYQGVTFWLQHYGQFDPDGMVLMIEIGTLAADADVQMCRQLLEYNYMTSAGLTGYNALMPGSDVLAYCIRIDFEKTPDAAEAVFEVVETMVAKKDEIEAILEKEMAKQGQQQKAEAPPPSVRMMNGLFI